MMRLDAWILGSIPLLIQYYVDRDKENDLNKTLQDLEDDLNFPRANTYDFIVVGGGTAGSFIAGKLSETFNVLLLESGGSPPPATQNWGLVGFTDIHPAINNQFTSVPQLNFSLENEGIVTSHTGRMLGGSGSHNANIYNRGSPYDFNHIAELLGDDSWKYENVMRHFKTFENFVGTLISEEEREEYYGNVGALVVDTAQPPMLPGWFQAARELGYDVADPNGRQIPSFTACDKSMKNGERDSAYTAFLKPYENTRNSLTILRYSHVEQILIDESKKAYGVAYSRHGIPQLAHASKEVILSCGTFQSPLILIKSGIGPKQTLDDAHIPIQSEVEGVGKNLLNHGWIWLDFTVNNINETLFSRVRDRDYEAELMKYNGVGVGDKGRKGYYSGMEEGLQAFVSSTRAKQEGQEGWPDLQLIYIQPVLGDEEIATIGLIADLNRPKSVGEIGFDTEAWKRGEIDDTKLALVDHKLFTEPSDAEVLIEGIKIMLQIAENTTVFRNMGVEFKTDNLPKACENITFRSDLYWKCFIEQRAQADLHVVGTCKMGRESDPMAVLNSKYRVRGIQNLRVVDASSLPIVTNANINAAVVLVASKATEDILKDYPMEDATDTASNIHSTAFFLNTFSLLFTISFTLYDA